MSLVEQIILLWCALILVSVNAHNSVCDRGRGGWYHNPTFISTRHCSHHTHDVLFNTRGGSTEEDDDSSTTTTVAENVEAAEAVEEEVSATDDDDVATSPEDDMTSSVDDVAKNYTFSATTPHDGSTEDPDGIPSRFLLMKKGDREGAKESFESTLAWRKEYDVDTILNRPHPLYDVCKAMVPHYFAGEDPHGNIVFVQRPALLDFELMKNNNATIDDLLMHYIYVIEYCWNILESGPPEGVMTNILDMRGMSFRAMRNQEYIEFGKRFVNMMSDNYPGRSYKTLVINAPKWFHALYKIFKPLLRESTRQKIVILKAGEQQDTALKFYLGDCMPTDLISDDKWAKPEPGTRWFLPSEDREECEPGPNSVMEVDMRQFCIERLEENDATMNEVL